MRNQHVQKEPSVLVEADTCNKTSVSGTSICTWSMKLLFQMGSNSPLAKRKARMFCAGSLPRKWSMRKICCSLKTSCKLAFKDMALGRSVPNGFSMMIRDRSTRFASPSIRAEGNAALGGMLK